MLRVAIACVLVSLPARAEADRAIDGVVYVDEDRSGTFSSGDTPVEGAAVFYSFRTYAVTDADGRYQMSAGDGAGIVWVSIPDGFVPTPVWEWAPDGDAATIDLGLTRSTATGPVTFVSASDTHAGLSLVSEADMAEAFAQATNIYPEPHFLVITGDITQANQPEQFASVNAALDTITTPFVPVPGNHDWYDGGAAYRDTYGPPNYSFDAGGARFIVFNDAESVANRISFLHLDLETVDDDRPVIAFIHAPPPPEFIDALEGAGVDYLFSGHLHSNRVHQYDTLLEYNTQPMIMGGIDRSPAGYRVVRLVEGAVLELEHHTTVAAPVTRLVGARECESEDGARLELMATVEVGASRPRVTARIDGGEPVELAFRGGWTYAGTAPLPTGAGEVELSTDTGVGAQATPARAVPIAARTVETTATLGEWSQFQGAAAHTGATGADLTPPLRLAWAVPTSDTVFGGSPVVAGGTVYVSLADFNAGRRGGVRAFDAATGEELWTHRAMFGVRGAPAVAGDVVVFTSTAGIVHAVSAATGEPLWAYQTGEGVEPQNRSLYTSPTVADDVVYAGNQREFGAFDAATGTPIWTEVPSDQGGWFGTTSSAIVAEGAVVTSFARGTNGMFAWDVQTGEQLWGTEALVTQGAHMSPVYADDKVFIGNELSWMYALDVFTGDIVWSKQLDVDSFAWGYELQGTPAYADGTLYVPSQSGGLYAVDAASGEVQWTYEGQEGIIHTAHYRAGVRAFSSAPVVSGSLLWIGGVDGVLRALDRSTGEEVWSADLGAPIMSAPAIAGDYMFVATYDGMLRAFVPEALVTGDGAARPACLPPAFDELPPELPEPPEPPGGCGCRSGTGSSGWIVAIAMLLAVARTIRHGRAPSPSPRSHSTIFPLANTPANRGVGGNRAVKPNTSPIITRPGESSGLTTRRRRTSNLR